MLTLAEIKLFEDFINATLEAGFVKSYAGAQGVTQMGQVLAREATGIRIKEKQEAIVAEETRKKAAGEALLEDFRRKAREADAQQALIKKPSGPAVPIPTHPAQPPYPLPGYPPYPGYDDRAYCTAEQDFPKTA